jgi:hypothetical protein
MDSRLRGNDRVGKQTLAHSFRVRRGSINQRYGQPPKQCDFHDFPASIKNRRVRFERGGFKLPHFNSDQTRYTSRKPPPSGTLRTILPVAA